MLTIFFLNFKKFISIGFTIILSNKKIFKHFFITNDPSTCEYLKLYNYILRGLINIYYLFILI